MIWESHCWKFLDRTWNRSVSHDDGSNWYDRFLRNKHLNIWTYFMQLKQNIHFRKDWVKIAVSMGGFPKSFRQGPLLVWNGQADIATVVNEAGIYKENGRDFSVENMFDENPNTCWHSQNQNGPHTIKIFLKVSVNCQKGWIWFSTWWILGFQKPINFLMLKIRKRMEDLCTLRYNHVCLVLNGNEMDQMCTNTPSGFNNDPSPFITWYKPTENVTTVELTFRDNLWAQIADLKIFHQPE